MSLNLSTYDGKPYVLAVDDEPLNRLILEDLIEDRFELHLVDSGQACLNAVKSKAPDLILLDINMPGMSGYEVCRLLKDDAKTEHIPIIFLTAKISSDDEKMGLQMGAVDYITKPFTESILLARMKTHLSLHHSRKLLEKNHKALQQERNYIEHLINAMRNDQRFDNQSIRQLVS
ncbi:MAG: response regulator, partial [Thiomicrorhabdus sp.]|nr:response regulator [Thiomicrorhabdus sp.]